MSIPILSKSSTAGGIAEKNPLLMQTYADVTGRGIRISRSAQTCALRAIAGAVVAGKQAGGFVSYVDEQRAMTGLRFRFFQPNPKAHAVYKYSLYRKLHDAFGTQQLNDLYHVMKELIEIRNRART